MEEAEERGGGGGGGGGCESDNHRERERERERERRGLRQKEKEEVLPERWLHQISLSLSLDFLAIESPSASLFSRGKSSCNSKGG